MPLTCNIDSRGKRLRLINGIILLLVAAGLAFWAWPAHQVQPWIIVGLCFFAGAFCVFEARAGWCALRAMGFKTRH